MTRTIALSDGAGNYSKHLSHDWKIVIDHGEMGGIKISTPVSIENSMPHQAVALFFFFKGEVACAISLQNIPGVTFDSLSPGETLTITAL